MPAPTAESTTDQLLPSHLAPLAYTSLPNTANAVTIPFTPEPRADQLLPSHLAMPLAVMPPAFVKEPPTYKSLPDTASANTLGLGGAPLMPKPSADQLLPFHLAIRLAARPPAFTNCP